MRTTRERNANLLVERVTLLLSRTDQWLSRAEATVPARVQPFENGCIPWMMRGW